MIEVRIDLVPQKEKPRFMVSQFDNERRVKFLLTENGEEVSIGAGTTSILTIRKPDGNIVTLNSVSYGPSNVVFDLTEQACACYGESWGEIVITENDYRIGTCNFIMEVERSPEDGGINSATAISTLQTQINGMVSESIGVLAPPIIAELVPSIVGDQYLTKAQIEEGYYSKAQVNQLLAQLSATIPHKITGTLAAGATSITLTDTATINALNDNSLVSIFTDEYGVNPTAATVDALTHSITLEFEALDHALNVAVTIL